MGKQKQDQGDGKKKGKKDGGVKAGRNKNPNGAYTTLANKKRRILREAHTAEKKYDKLYRRGVFRTHQHRAIELLEHISRLRQQAKQIIA